MILNLGTEQAGERLSLVLYEVGIGLPRLDPAVQKVVALHCEKDERTKKLATIAAENGRCRCRTFVRGGYRFNRDYGVQRVQL